MIELGDDVVLVLMVGYLICCVATSAFSLSAGKRWSASSPPRTSSLGWIALAGLAWPLLVVGVVEGGSFVALASLWRSLDAARERNAGSANGAIVLQVAAHE